MALFQKELYFVNFAQIIHFLCSSVAYLPLSNCFNMITFEKKTIIVIFWNNERTNYFLHSLNDIWPGIQFHLKQPENLHRRH